MEALFHPEDSSEEQVSGPRHPSPLALSRRFGKDPVRVKEVPSLLLKERIVFVPPAINDEVANFVVALLLYLESQDTSKDIHMYINCHGSLDGNFYYGLGIYDTMQCLKAEIATYCVGVAQGVAAALLAGGTKGKRFCLPHAQVVLHQPYSAARGQASDIDILAREIVRQRQLFHEIMSKHTNKSGEEIRQDADRRRYMTAQQALEYGLVDEIIYPDELGKNE
ncbi:MAG TPA: ATP-dependent Clp protease proteolytic subunit [Ktedonobacteraceae bacterium]|nr:ATP-dependent Clp protease proteolytic subunit [Ktedonobacteraceae bacterium]